MRTIIAGSRTITDYALVDKAVCDSHFKITEVVTGCARGVDTLGEIWAVKHQVPIKRFPASWYKLGRVAGVLRNREMAEYADSLICVHNGSPGSKNMIYQAMKSGLRIFEVRLKPHPNKSNTGSPDGLL